MQAWEQFVSDLEKELDPLIVSKWIRTLKVVHFDACNLYLEANDPFHLNWFEEHLRARVKRELVNKNFHPIAVHLTTPGSQQASQKKRKPMQNMASQPSLQPVSFSSDAPIPTASFSNFLVAKNSGFAVKALMRLTDDSSSENCLFNPIYLYGEEGAGKSHLLMATANAYLAQKKRVLFLHAQSFTDHLIAAIRQSQMDHFRKWCRSVDLFIIDDIHLFAKRAATQEEFFHTFNALHAAKKQIILSGKLPPNGLEEIEPRLISRFEWGLVLSLDLLNGEQKKEYLLLLAKERAVSLSTEVIDFLCDSFQKMSSLQRAFDAICLRMKGPATALSEVKKSLQDILDREEAEKLTAEKIIALTAEQCGILPKELLSRGQTKMLSYPRQLAIYLCRSKLELTFKKIGQLFSRDHSTIISSIAAIERKIQEREPETVAFLSAMEKKL